MRVQNRMTDKADDEDDEAEQDDLTISVFLRGAFLRAAESRTAKFDEDGLFELIEGRIRSQYPRASISVQTAELLDADWESQIGEMRGSELTDARRTGIRDQIQALVGEVLSRDRD